MHRCYSWLFWPSCVVVIACFARVSRMFRARFARGSRVVRACVLRVFCACFTHGSRVFPPSWQNSWERWAHQRVCERFFLDACNSPLRISRACTNLGVFASFSKLPPTLHIPHLHSCLNCALASTSHLPQLHTCLKFYVFQLREFLKPLCLSFWTLAKQAQYIDVVKHIEKSRH